MTTPALCTNTDIANLFRIAPGGLSQGAFTTAEFAAHIQFASSQFISAAKSVYNISDDWSPDLATIGEDVRSIVATIAAYGLMVARGVSNNVEIDGLLKQRFDWAMDRIDRMQDDILHLPLPLADAAIPIPTWSSRGNYVGSGGVTSAEMPMGRED